MMTKSVDDTKMINTIYNFFKHFEVWCGPSPATPSINELEKYLSKHLQMFNNGQLVVRGAANYLDRLQKFQKIYSNFKVSGPLEKPVITGNQAAIYYQLDLTTHTNQHKQICIIGLFTIEDDKISRWVEVTHDKDTSSWDE